jgi:FkbM family methyltransferase
VSVRRVLHQFLRSVGFEVVKVETLEQLEALRIFPDAISRWSSLEELSGLFQFVMSRLDYSKGQLQQDLVAEYIYLRTPEVFNPTKTFLEFGAASGVALSNTYYLEKNLGWSGLLCEPSPNFHKSIIDNRSADLDQRCVSSFSNLTLNFRMTDNPELATLEEYINSDSHADYRRNGRTISVNTVSLDDLLQDWNISERLFYLSVDTEGSEYEILREYSFKIKPIFLSIEHNFTANETQLDSLLERNGYIRILRSVSLFDGWYLQRELIQLVPELRLMARH